MNNDEWDGKPTEPLHVTDGYWADDEKSDIIIENKSKQYVFDFDKINTLEDIIKVIKAMDLHIVMADTDSQYDEIRDLLKEI